MRQTLSHEDANLGHMPLEFSNFAQGCSRFDLAIQDVADAAEILHGAGYLQASKTLGSRSPSHLHVTTAGVEAVIHVLVDEYAEAKRRVAAAVVNLGMNRSSDIAKESAVAQAVVHHMLQLWADAGWLRLSNTVAPTRQIYGVTPHLRRWLLG